MGTHIAGFPNRYEVISKVNTLDKSHGIRPSFKVGKTGCIASANIQKNAIKNSKLSTKEPSSVCYNRNVRQGYWMKTTVRKLDGLPIEEPVLDDEGLRRQKELSELAVREYEESGKLTGKTLNEKVTEYETDIAGHLIKE